MNQSVLLANYHGFTRLILILFLMFQFAGYACASQDIKELQRFSALGDAAAQAELGIIYYEGKGVAKDAKEGYLWIRKAADQEYPMAELYVGIIYTDGKAVIKDDK